MAFLNSLVLFWLMLTLPKLLRLEVLSAGHDLGVVDEGLDPIGCFVGQAI